MSAFVVFSLYLGLAIAAHDPLKAWENLALSGKVITVRPLQVSAKEYDRPMASQHRLARSDDDKPIPTPHKHTLLELTEPSPEPQGRLLGSADEFWLPKRSFDKVIDHYLYGGSDAEKNISPGMVSIQILSKNSVMHMCGGSLAAPNKVLTAAHCFDNFEKHHWQVALGYHKLSDGIKNTNSQVIEVDYLEYHAYYDFDVIDSPYDIAVLTLTENAVITPGYVEIMKYTTKLAADLAGSSAVLIGWGDLNHKGKEADILQYGDYKVLSTSECREHWPGSTVHRLRNICAISKKSGDCMGDSGGPLLDSDGTQIGIVSWGHYKCNPKFPGVFISVGFYHDWTIF